MHVTDMLVIIVLCAFWAWGCLSLAGYLSESEGEEE